MTHSLIIFLVGGLSLLVQPETTVELREIEQGFEDVSPLAASSEVTPIDLRKPFGFERVYEITDPRGRTRFIRIDNGIVAVFDRSDYIPGLDVAFIPPNTRFHIGTEDFLDQSEHEIHATEASGRIDRRLNLSASNRAGTTPRDAEPAQPDFVVPGPPAIVTNEAYRRVRIAQLLSDAIRNP